MPLANGEKPAPHDILFAIGAGCFWEPNFFDELRRKALVVAYLFPPSGKTFPRIRGAWPSTSPRQHFQLNLLPRRIPRRIELKVLLQSHPQLRRAAEVSS